MPLTSPALTFKAHKLKMRPMAWDIAHLFAEARGCVCVKLVSWLVRADGSVRREKRVFPLKTDRKNEMGLREEHLTPSPQPPLPPECNLTLTKTWARDQCST